MQNLSIGVNVVREGSPSRTRRVLLISLGMTILPKSSTRLTIPVVVIGFRKQNEKTHNLPKVSFRPRRSRVEESTHDIDLCSQIGVKIPRLTFVRSG